MAYAIGTDKREGTVVPSRTTTPARTTGSLASTASKIGGAVSGTAKTLPTGSKASSTTTTKDTTTGRVSEVSKSSVGSGVSDVDWNKSETPSGGSRTTRASTGGVSKVDPETKLSFGQMLDFIETPAMNERILSSPLDKLIAGGKGIDFATGLPGGTSYLDRMTVPASEPTAPRGLNSPKFYERLDQNEGSAPFEGIVDWGGIYDFLQEPYRQRIAEETRPKGPAGRGRKTVEDQRLPAEPLPAVTTPPPFVADTKADVVELLPTGEVDEQGRQVSEFVEPQEYVDPRMLPPEQRWGWKSPFADMSTVIQQALGNDPKTPSFSDYGQEGLVTGPASGIDAAAEPSKWDGIVDNAGKLLSHTGLGSIVSTLFPDLWEAGGDMMKGLGLHGGKQPDSVTELTTWNPLEGTWTGGGALAPKDGYYDTTPHTKVKDKPPIKIPGDLNGDGVVDDKDVDTDNDGTPDVDEKPTGGTGGGKNRRVTFPGEDYDPGVDNEFLYFRGNPWAPTIKRFAAGGLVPYAEGGDVGMLDGQDPRVTAIADAEDALENMATGQVEADDEPAIRKFIELFGEEMLDQLRANVTAGLKMRKRGEKGRMVVGPGGPTDDAIPAVIDDTQPAKLSSGEFVVPAGAVAGAGDGDPVAGAEKLQQLSEALSARDA